VKQYLPDKDMIVGGGLPDREFFLGVLSTIKEQETRELISKCLKDRYEAPEGDSNKDCILVS
jgi:hypothetical protein